MRILLTIILMSACLDVLACAQTADELVAKNLQAKGGLEKIRAVKSLRMTGRMQQGQFVAQVGEEAKAPDLLRQNFTVEGMTAIQAYDGKTGWQVSPFEGRRDPELLGEDDLRDLVEQADFYGPLVDYQAKGNTVQYLGHDQVDGDDAYRLKVTLKNGDIIYYDLDPDTYMEIRTDKQQFIRGAVKETVTDLGSYKQVNGVYYPFSIASGPKHDPRQLAHITLEKIEANVPIPDSEFAMPAAPSVPSPQKHTEPPASKSKKIKPSKTKPPA